MHSPSMVFPEAYQFNQLITPKNSVAKLVLSFSAIFKGCCFTVLIVLSTFIRKSGQAPESCHKNTVAFFFFYLELCNLQHTPTLCLIDASHSYLKLTKIQMNPSKGSRKWSAWTQPNKCIFVGSTVNFLTLMPWLFKKMNK